MSEDEMEKRLENLYRKLAAGTKQQDSSEYKKVIAEINQLQQVLFPNKIKPSTSGEGPDPTTILPQWSATGKKVQRMKIEKRRRPGSGGNIEPMGL